MGKDRYGQLYWVIYWFNISMCPFLVINCLFKSKKYGDVWVSKTYNKYYKACKEKELKKISFMKRFLNIIQAPYQDIHLGCRPKLKKTTFSSINQWIFFTAHPPSFKKTETAQVNSKSYKMKMTSCKMKMIPAKIQSKTTNWWLALAGSELIRIL